jgi:hypothetical protein
MVVVHWRVFSLCLTRIETRVTIVILRSDMKASSVNEIKKELRMLDLDTMLGICMRLAKYKKENKELITYLLFEAQDEHSYIASIKREIDELFKSLPRGNTYFIKKSLRKILRFVNRQVKYSSIGETEVEIRIYFCACMKKTGVLLPPGTVLFNIYQQQVKKIVSLVEKLPEDIQSDYQRDINKILIPS